MSTKWDAWMNARNLSAGDIEIAARGRAKHEPEHAAVARKLYMTEDQARDLLRAIRSEVRR